MQLRLTHLALLGLTTVFCVPAFADLTREQRRADFTQIAPLYWRNYGPYEWKRDFLQFDLADLRPWLARVDAARNDLEYLDVCKQYTGALRDGHVSFAYPTTFVTQAPINVDIYDGKATVEALGAAMFALGIQPGDEILTFNGKPVDEEIASFYPYTTFGGNPRGERRWAANYLFFRHQQIFPLAPDFPDSAEVTVRHMSGEEETITVPFTRSGEPLRSFGELPPFLMLRGGKGGRTSAGGGAGSPIDPALIAGMDVPEDAAPGQRALFALDYSARRVETYEKSVRGFGAFAPPYAFPAGFSLRRGSGASDSFVSGVYPAGGKRIGYLRFPGMAPSNLSLAYTQLEQEIQFLQENTDGLVVDVMRNRGGYGLYSHEIARRLIPYPWTGQGLEIRATAGFLASFSAEREALVASGGPQYMIDQYDWLITMLREAQAGNRTRTGPMPINMPSLDMQPAAVVYTKPLIVLIDEFSVSAADMFPAMIQDANRGALVGYRTGGFGGSVQSFSAGALSETQASVTVGMRARSKMIDSEYGVTNYIENVGVRPDIELDIMTIQNYRNSGRPFVNAFTEIILDKIGR